MKGISLSSVIQVINLERQSCDVEAQADGQSGQLHFRDGTLVDAMADGLAGEAAAYEILAWENPEFEVNTEDSPRDRTIDADLTHMLLETARRQDEEKADIARAATAAAPNAPVASIHADASQSPFAAPPAPPVLKPVAAPAVQATTPPAAAATTSASGAKGAAAPAAATDAAGNGALNVAGLKRVIQIAQDGLADALVSADVFSTADGTSYVGVNSQPAGCALINQLTERMMWSLDKGGLPPLGRYYMAELVDGRMLLVAPCGGVQLSLVVDSTRVQLGLLLNVILPEVLSALEEVSPR